MIYDYYSTSWLLNMLNTNKYIGKWDRDRKIFYSNVGGWATSEYPIKDIKIIEIYKHQCINFRNDKSNEKIEVVALVKMLDEEYGKFECKTIGDLLDFISTLDKNYLIGAIASADLENGGWFCEIIDMHDASVPNEHDCDNHKARIIYGENIFRLWN